MAYVTPGTVAAGDVATAAAWNVLTNDVIDHEERLHQLAGTATLATTFTTTSTSAVDVTGFSVTFTAIAAHRYKISAYLNIGNSGSAVTQGFINVGATALAEAYSQPLAGNISTVTIHAIQTPGAGSVTYKIQFQTAAGTGTMYGASTRASIASRMLVEDLGI